MCRKQKKIHCRPRAYLTMSFTCINHNSHGTFAAKHQIAQNVRLSDTQMAGSPK